MFIEISLLATIQFENKFQAPCSSIRFPIFTNSNRSTLLCIPAFENFDFKEEAINGIMQIGCAFASQWICDYAKKGIISDKHESSQHQIFKRFLELVVEHHQKERTVSFYANKLCITPKYLSQLVVNVSGKYAYDIIRDQVIFRAKALLKSKQYSVQQVADELSFSNVSFFCKYFRESVGMSPKSYMLNKIS